MPDKSKGLVTSITTFPARFLGSAIFTASATPAHRVASTSNSPNDAVSANVPDDAFIKKYQKQKYNQVQDSMMICNTLHGSYYDKLD